MAFETPLTRRAALGWLGAAITLPAAAYPPRSVRLAR